MGKLISGPWKTLREYDMTAADKRGVFLTQPEWKQTLEEVRKRLLLRVHRMIMHEAQQCSEAITRGDMLEAQTRLVNMAGIFERLAEEDPLKKPEDKEEA